jgi:hypothetical protein
MLPNSATNRITVFKIGRGLAAPVWREDKNVMCRRSSSTHAWRGGRSRRSGSSRRGEASLWVGNTRSDVVGLAAAVFTFGAAFFLDFPAAGLVAAVVLGSGFLGQALGCLIPSATDWREGLGLGGGVVVVLTTRPLGQRDSTPRPGPSARQRDRPTMFSMRRGGLSRRRFRDARALALQGQPWPLST